MKKGYLTFLLAVGVLVLPSSAEACNMEKKAKEYIDKIYASSPTHYGTKKPKLIYNTTKLEKYGKSKKKYLAGEANGTTITIYEKALDKGFGKKCTEEHWKDLKQVVAHEYGHHIDFNKGKGITKLLKTSDAERAAIVAGEHILHTKTWGKKGWQADSLKKGEKGKQGAVKKYLESL